MRLFFVLHKNKNLVWKILCLFVIHIFCFYGCLLFCLYGKHKNIIYALILYKLKGKCMKYLHRLTSPTKSCPILKFHTLFKTIRKVCDFSSGKSYVLCHILPVLHVSCYVLDNTSCCRFIQHIKLMGIIKTIERTIVRIGINKQCLKHTIRWVYVVSRRQFPAFLTKQERMISKVIVGIATISK